MVTMIWHEARMEGQSRSTSCWVAFFAACLACLLLTIPSPAFAGRLEAGSFTAHATNANPNPVRITFQQPFDVTPIVVALSDQTGNQSAAIRITNVTTTGFDELIIEPDAWDGTHIAQQVHYIAVEPGRHVLPDGRIIEAGFVTTSAVQHGAGVSGTTSWFNVSFSAPLPTIPSVVSQIQTANSETRTVASQSSRPFITATQNSVGLTGFQVALERSEAQNGPAPSAETIGWIAFPAGLSGTFPSVGGSTITWSAVNTGTNIAGWDNGCFTNGFGQTSSSRIAVAKKITRIGGDGGWLRRCSLSSTTIGLTVDEDTSRDSERGHINEQASIITFSQSFHADLAAQLSVTKLRSSTDDGQGSDFHIPDALIDYLITVTNLGNSRPNQDSVVVVEQLPAHLDLMVSDLGAPGSGPVLFEQGSPASDLSCSFSSLASTSDCFEFSQDGSDYSYVPSDSGDGSDPDVRFIRITPNGFMAPDAGTGSPSFRLRLRTRLQ